MNKLDADLEKIVIGQILSRLSSHPDADKLVICQVNIGDEADSDRYRRS